MPHGFEYIVRPYQQPGSQSNAVIASTPRGTRERAHLVWGGKGTMPAVKILNPSTTVNVCHETATEQDRDSAIIRIEQPGNPENWVDVARAEKMRLDKTEKNTNPTSLSVLSYAQPKLDPRVETDPGFHVTLDDPNPDKRCGLVWSFKNQI